MARRGENIYKRKDGRWEGRSLNKSGKYHYFYAKTYKEVKEKMKDFKEDKEKVKSIKYNNASEQFLTWLTGDVSSRVKPSTYESYYSCVYKHIIPFFMKSEHNCIEKKSVSSFVISIREDVLIAETSKKKILAIFKIALKEILKTSPQLHELLELVKLPSTDYGEVQVFTSREQRTIEQGALNAKDACSIGVILCFYTGIRLGELCALKWSDIDFESGTMSILRTVSRIRVFDSKENKTTLHVGLPKSRKSIRKIPLPEFLLNLLTSSSLYTGNNTCFIFTGNEDPYNPRRFQKMFKKILRDNHIVDRKFHAIRHTFATRALELGVDIKTVSELLGHSGVSITLNVYAHSLMEHKKAAINKFNDLYIMNAENAKLAVNYPVLHTESVCL